MRVFRVAMYTVSRAVNKLLFWVGRPKYLECMYCRALGNMESVERTNSFLGCRCPISGGKDKSLAHNVAASICVGISRYKI